MSFTSYRWHYENLFPVHVTMEIQTKAIYIYVYSIKRVFVFLYLISIIIRKMFLRKQFDKRTGVYRSSDPIENFKIR